MIASIAESTIAASCASARLACGCSATSTSRAASEDAGADHQHVGDDHRAEQPGRLAGRARKPATFEAEQRGKRGRAARRSPRDGGRRLRLTEVKAASLLALHSAPSALPRVRAGHRPGADPQVRRERTALHVVSDRRSLRRGVRRAAAAPVARQAQHRRLQPAALALRAPAVLRHALLLLRVQQDRDSRPREIGQVYQVLGEGIGAARAARRASRARCTRCTGAAARRPSSRARRCARWCTRSRRSFARAPRTRVLDRDRPAQRRARPHGVPRASSASTASRSACRTSTRRCRRRCTASRASRPRGA